MEIKNCINSVVPQGDEVMFTHTWLAEYLNNMGYSKITFKPREMPVYERKFKVDANGNKELVRGADGNGEYVITGKDANGKDIRKVGYKSIKIEFTYCDALSEDFVNVFESTNRVDTSTGDTVDVSPWAYNVLSKFEREKIMKYGIRNICLRTGVYATKDKDGNPVVKRRQTWDAVVLGNGEVLTPVGKKRGYLDYDANPDDPTAEPAAE